MYCLLLQGKRRTTKHADFGTQSLSALFPNYLHLISIVTFASLKLATNDTAKSYYIIFPLINLYILLGVPFILSILLIYVLPLYLSEPFSTNSITAYFY